VTRRETRGESTQEPAEAQGAHRPLEREHDPVVRHGHHDSPLRASDPNRFPRRAARIRDVLEDRREHHAVEAPGREGETLRVGGHRGPRWRAGEDGGIEIDADDARAEALERSGEVALLGAHVERALAGRRSGEAEDRTPSPRLDRAHDGVAVLLEQAHRELAVELRHSCRVGDVRPRRLLALRPRRVPAQEPQQHLEVSPDRPDDAQAGRAGLPHGEDRRHLDDPGAGEHQPAEDLRRGGEAVGVELDAAREVAAVGAEGTGERDHPRELPPRTRR
jgi:hypothetical protein